LYPFAFISTVYAMMWNLRMPHTSAFLPFTLLVAQCVAHAIESDSKIMRKVPVVNMEVDKSGKSIDVGTTALAEDTLREAKVQPHHQGATAPKVPVSYKSDSSSQRATTMGSCNNHENKIGGTYFEPLCQSANETHEFHCCDSDTRELVNFSNFMPMESGKDCSSGMPSMSYKGALAHCKFFGKYLCSYLEIESLVQCGAKCGDNTPSARRVWVASDCSDASNADADKVVLDASGNEVVTRGILDSEETPATPEEQATTEGKEQATPEGEEQATPEEEEYIKNGVCRTKISGVFFAIVALFGLQG